MHAETDEEHPGCKEQYRRQTADKCVMCTEPILNTFFTVDTGKIHGEVRYAEQRNVAASGARGCR